MRPKSIVDQCVAADNRSATRPKAAGCSHSPPPSHVRRGDDGDRPDPDGERRSVAHHRAAAVMLALATVGFAVNFWAWALLSPLGTEFKDALHLTPFQQALLVAVPVVVGSLGRIPVGALTDRFGGRVMFPLVSLRHDRPGAVLGLAGHTVAGRPAGRRVLPRHRRHRVRRRRAVRQRLVPAGAARPRHRGLRRRHGRHGDQRADHGQARQGARHRDAVRDHRDRAGRLRRAGGAGAARRARPGRADRAAGTAAGAAAAAADHLAGAPRCTPSPSAATSRSPSTCRPT